MIGCKAKKYHMPNHNVTAVLSADEMSFPIDYETRTGKRALRQANIFITICCSFIYLLFNLLVNSERKTGGKEGKACHPVGHKSQSLGEKFS